MGRIVGSASDFPLPVTLDPPFKSPTPGGAHEILSSLSNYFHLAGKSLKSPAMERIGAGERIFAAYSDTAPATQISKPLRKHGNFKAHPGLRACLRKGRWRRKGNREGNRLWPVVFNIFNALIECGPFQDDADLAIGGMVLARDAASIAVQFFGWRPRGWDGEQGELTLDRHLQRKGPRE